MFVASTINYLDRQTLSVLKPHLQTVLHWSESDYGWIVFAFQLAYALLMHCGRRGHGLAGDAAGYALSATWWSIAAIAHALARGALSFGVARFLLGAGEAGNFPAAIKAVAEWFPKRERALATGIFNAGPTIGAVIAPPLVVWLTLRWGWRGRFIFTGALGFLWVVFWAGSLPAFHASILGLLPANWSSSSERKMRKKPPGRPNPVAENPRLSAGVGSSSWPRFMTDPIWWFYIFWLPSYLKQGRGFTLQEIGLFAWIPFLVSGVGSVAGGWLSGFFLKRGWPREPGAQDGDGVLRVLHALRDRGRFRAQYLAGARPSFPFPLPRIRDGRRIFTLWPRICSPSATWAR